MGLVMSQTKIYNIKSFGGRLEAITPLEPFPMIKFAPWFVSGIFGILQLAPSAQAVRFLESDALVPCSNDGVLSVNKFNVVYTPNSKSATVSFDGSATYSGKVSIDVVLLVYGYNATTKTIDPCDFQIEALCPIKPTTLKITNFPLDLSSVDLSMIPGIVYNIPDLDAVVRLYIKAADSRNSVSCVEARVSNGKTVNQMGVAWAVAVLTGLGLIATIVVSILGQSNNEVAFRTLLFLHFMQSQAMYGMAAVDQRPIVQSWTQIFQWSMGLVHAEFLQTICTWFQRATGGTPSRLLKQLNEYSVIMDKRSLNLASFEHRSTDTTSGVGQRTVHGIERVGFRVNIESTNIFMTSYLFFHFVTVLFLLCIIFLKSCLPLILRKLDNKNLVRAIIVSSNWKDFVRGSLYRLASLGYPQVCVLGLWELIHRDSAAEIVLAIMMWFSMTVVVAWEIFKVCQHARLSRTLKQNATNAACSDLAYLTRWGFLYTNYKATTYYFRIPLALYTVAKGTVIAFAQSNPVAQSIVLSMVEAAMMVATIIVKPYMTRTANGFAISAAVLNFINSVFFVVFSNVFNQPDIMSGIMSVLFFLFNGIFVFILLIFLLIGLYYVAVHKAPTRTYERLSDNSDLFRVPENGRVIELQPLQKKSQEDDGHLETRGNVWKQRSSHCCDEINTEQR